MSVKTTYGAGAVWEEMSPRTQSYNPRRPPLGTFENQDTSTGKTRYI